MADATGAQAMQRIQDHIDECGRNYLTNAKAQNDLRESIRDLSKTLIGFIGAVFMVVIGFAGYTYATEQRLLENQRTSQAATVEAMHKTAEETVKKLAELPP